MTDDTRPPGFDEPEQATLFDVGTSWEKEWQGMPEFVQEDQRPWKTLYVHFENRHDMEDFARLIGQKLTQETRSVWFPEAEIGTYADKRYVSK